LLANPIAIVFFVSYSSNTAAKSIDGVYSLPPRYFQIGTNNQNLKAFVCPLKPVTFYLEQ